MRIKWVPAIRGPYPGEIVAEDGRRLLIQQDTDFPGVAGTFGWSTRRMQKCPYCQTWSDTPIVEAFKYTFDCPTCEETIVRCDHRGTDGTVACDEPGCRVPPIQFIASAIAYMSEEAEDAGWVEDPGYFSDN